MLLYGKVKLMVDKICKINHKMKLKLVFLFICVFPIGNGFAQLSEEGKKALFYQDLSKLKTVYNSSDDKGKMCIVDAMCNNGINWSDLTFEQISDVVDEEESNDTFNSILYQQLKLKELEIIRYVENLDAEQTSLYCQYFPERTKIVIPYLESVMSNILDSIPYLQLDYLNRKLHINGYGAVSQYYQKRSSERKSLVKSRTKDYCDIESSYRDRLIYLMKIGAWQYLYSRYEGVAKSYSKIGIVSDAPYIIGQQYKKIVHAYFTSKDFTSQMQKIVSSYNASINKARADFAKEANVEGYPLSNISVPPIGNFAYDDNYDILNLVPQARISFVESRETAGTVADIASFFFGSIASTIGKGLFDLYAVSSLAEDEINARKALMEDVYSKLNHIIQRYCDSISGNIENQIKTNQSKFEKYVKNYK